MRLPAILLCICSKSASRSTSSSTSLDPMTWAGKSMRSSLWSNMLGNIRRMSSLASNTLRPRNCPISSRLTRYRKRSRLRAKLTRVSRSVLVLAEGPALTFERSSSTEMYIRTVFIDFVQGLLNMDPIKRWSPQQAKLHPFITGERFTGHWGVSSLPDQGRRDKTDSRHRQPTQKSTTTSANSARQSASTESRSQQSKYANPSDTDSSRATRGYADANAYNQYVEMNGHPREWGLTCLALSSDKPRSSNNTQLNSNSAIGNNNNNNSSNNNSNRRPRTLLPRIGNPTSPTMPSPLLSMPLRAKPHPTNLHLNPPLVCLRNLKVLARTRFEHTRRNLVFPRTVTA